MGKGRTARSGMQGEQGLGQRNRNRRAASATRYPSQSIGPCEQALFLRNPLLDDAQELAQEVPDRSDRNRCCHVLAEDLRTLFAYQVLRHRLDFELDDLKVTRRVDDILVRAILALDETKEKWAIEPIVANDLRDHPRVPSQRHERGGFFVKVADQNDVSGP